MNASCCASVLPSTHHYTYRACDTSTTASRIAPARPKMLSIALVVIVCIYMGKRVYSTLMRKKTEAVAIARNSYVENGEEAYV